MQPGPAFTSLATLAMPVNYEFDGRTVVLRLGGLYDTSDIRAALIAALDDPARPEITGMLFDIRGSRSIAARTADEVRVMAQFLANHAARFGRRLALLADSDAAFGLMRLGAVDIEQRGVDSRAFRDASEADAWLKR